MDICKVWSYFGRNDIDSLLKGGVTDENGRIFWFNLSASDIEMAKQRG
jgi:hypothetical protein